MDFEYPFMLFMLLFVPLIAALFYLAVRHNEEMRRRFGDWAVFQNLIPNYAPKRSPLKFGLVVGAYILLVIAAANPRMGSRTQKVKRAGVDVYIAVDISKSMWAKDVTPKNIDRLEKARRFALKLVEELRGERIGLIFFAGEAFIKMPLTLDYASTLLFLNDEIDHTELLPGTALDKVVEVVSKATANQKPSKKRRPALVIISDGEEHEQQAVDAAAEGRNNNGVTTFTVAVGSSQGAPIPLLRDKQAGYHTDKSDKVVQTAVNKVWLKEVAEAGGGRFFDLENQENLILKKLRKDLNEMEKGEFDEQQFDKYDTYYQYLVLLALILLSIEFVISYRKKKEVDKESQQEQTPLSKMDRLDGITPPSKAEAKAEL